MSDVRNSRLRKLERLKSLRVDPYPSSFLRSHSISELLRNYENLEAGSTTGDVVTVAGRIYRVRNSGLFIDIRDTSSTIQIFVSKVNLRCDHFKVVSLLDLGDIVGVKGIVRRTLRGSLTVNAQEVTCLSKAILPLPEKFHGLTDTETRYRQRYLDLLTNERSRRILRSRSAVVSAMRSYLGGKKFMEVETPMLHTSASGASACPFVTTHKALGVDLFLRTTPELFLKRLIIGGLDERIYEINRSFRNEGMSSRHSPEFTMIEIYQSYADGNDMMDLVEDLLQTIAKNVFGTLEFPLGSGTLSLKGPWKRIPMVNLIEEITGVNFRRVTNPQLARGIASSLGVNLCETLQWGEVVEAVFKKTAERKLTQPTYVTEFPRDISPLARPHPHDPLLSERFECYINGWEIANGFSELADPIDQRNRLLDQEARQKANQTSSLDLDFITALEYGIPPTGGVGVGIDRLVALLTNSRSIRDVIAFPLMRPKQSAS